MFESSFITEKPPPEDVAVLPLNEDKSMEMTGRVGDNTAKANPPPIFADDDEKVLPLIFKEVKRAFVDK